MTNFTEEVLEIIRNIPKGKVMTYGQIADLGGNPKAARQVVRILHSMSKKYNLPWYRVVNAKGEIALKDDFYYEQMMLLLNEGIELDNGSIDLSKYKWNP